MPNKYFREGARLAIKKVFLDEKYHDPKTCMHLSMRKKNISAQWDTFQNKMSEKELR